jgi:DNA-binding GntR family transcriptional regulator
MSEMLIAKTTVVKRNLLASDTDLKRDAVYERLLQDIICAEFEPGDRIDEAALAKRYRTGRAGVRDALYRLSLEGLVERRPRIGTIVSAPSFFELQEVFELRVQIEGHCAALAAKNARASDIARIKAAFADANRIIAEADWRTLVRCDQIFHRAMAAASRNQWLERTLVMAHNSGLRFWHHALPRRPTDAVINEIAIHRKIADAIEARDPTGAQAAMRALLAEFPATVRGLFNTSLEKRA